MGSGVGLLNQLVLAETLATEFEHRMSRLGDLAQRFVGG